MSFDDESMLDNNGGFNLRSFSSDVIIFSIGQAMLLVFGFIKLLIIPKYLTIEDYGYWNLFLLYGLFVGLLQLGFIDGLLVRWAGKQFRMVDSEFKIAFRFLFIEQIIIIVPLILLSYFLFDGIYRDIALAVMIFAFIVNFSTFFRFTAQATKKFRLITVLNLNTQVTLILFILLIFSFGYINYYYTIFAMLAACLITLLGYSLFFARHTFKSKKYDTSLWDYGKKNINIGIFILMGNIIVILFFTIDRLMVDYFFSITQFAIYSFALTAATVVVAFVSAISAVLFPYLSGSTIQMRIKIYKLAKPALILSWGAILTIYFPFSRLIETYLHQYISSLFIMKVLLCTIGFGSLIQILHVSYFKAHNKQRQYFLFSISALIIAVILNLLAVEIWGTLESIAIATLISFGGWYILNELSLKSISGENNRQIWKGFLLIISYMIAFWLAFLLSDKFLFQMLIYIIFFSLISWFTIRSEIKNLMSIAMNLLNWKK